MVPAIERLVTRGVSVRVRGAGTGMPMLFLHGAGGWPAWLPFFERMAQRFTLSVPEHPGFGVSDDPQWLRDVADLAMYYLDVLGAVYASPVHLVGHSLGGWTAAEIAVRNAHRIASLTLLAPAGIRVNDIPPADSFLWSPEESARNRFYDQALFEESLKAPPPTDEEIDIDMQNKRAAVKFGWEPRWYNPALEKWLHRIAVPTQVIWGLQDKLLPSAYGKLWGERIPHAQVSIIEACAHSPHIEKCDIVADKVVAFLDQVRP